MIPKRPLRTIRQSYKLTILSSWFSLSLDCLPVKSAKTEVVAFLDKLPWFREDTARYVMWIAKNRSNRWARWMQELAKLSEINPHQHRITKKICGLARQILRSHSRVKSSEWKFLSSASVLNCNIDNTLKKRQYYPSTDSQGFRGTLPQVTRTLVLPLFPHPVTRQLLLLVSILDFFGKRYLTKSNKNNYTYWLQKNSKILGWKLKRFRTYSKVWLQLLRETARRTLTVDPSKTPSTTDEVR